VRVSFLTPKTGVPKSDETHLEKFPKFSGAKVQAAFSGLRID